TSFTNAGSLRFPRYGTGARNGESVSINIRSSGTSFAASRICCALGKVTFPEKEIMKPRSSARCACAGLPVKQCSTPASPLEDQCCFTNEKKSSQALSLSCEGRL